MPPQILQSDLDNLDRRISALEKTVNDLITASRKFITLQQINELNVITQTDIDEIRKTLDSVLTRVQRLEDDTVDY